MKIPFFYIIIFVLGACSGIKSADKKEMKIVKVDSFNILVPDSIHYIDLARNWNFNDSTLSYLCETNSPDELKLYTYRFNDKTWSTLSLSKEGPNGVNSHGNYDIIGNKVIYFPAYTNKILILNLEDGTIENSFEYGKDITIPTIKKTNIHFSDSTVIFPSTNMMHINDEFFNTSKLFSKLNFFDNTETRIIGYPNNYLTDHTPSINYQPTTYTFSGDSILYSFKKDHNIYIYDINTGEITSFQCRNKNIHKINRTIQDNNPYLVAFAREFEGEYKLLLFDKNTRVYYRISVHYEGYSGRIPKDKEAFNSLLESRSVNIVALDQEFNTIANNDFKGITDAHFLINSNGLYMRSLHEEENMIVFINMKLTPNI